MKKKWLDIHTLDIYIIFCFLMIITYTVTHIIVFLTTGIEMTIIAALVYGFFGGEVLLCALLKKLKLKQEFEQLMALKKKEGMCDEMAG